MSLFSRKDWNVIAIMFETKQLFRVNGNRGKGSDAEKSRDGAKQHPRTLVWAVFDQKGGVLESEIGRAREQIARDRLQRLVDELPRLRTVREVLSMLENGKSEKVAKPLQWDGYPKDSSQ